MTFKGMKKLTGLSLPNFAGSIVTASNESMIVDGLLIAIFIETAVGERENMALQGFEEFEVLLVFFRKLVDEF
jgi:hypothetical protein